MKILCVIQRYDPVLGGTEILAKSFMDFLSKTHEVTVYTTTALDIESFWKKNNKNTIISANSNNYEIKRCDFLTPTEIKFDEKLQIFPLINSHPGPFSPKMWHDLVLKKINYDLIYVTSFPYDHIIPAYVAAKKWKIPIIIWPAIHQEFPDLYLTSMRLTMLNNAEAIFVQTQAEKNILVKQGVESNKLSVIPPVISTNSTDANPNEFKKKILPNTDEKFVLFVGSKSSFKGIIHLIEAMKVVWKEKHTPYLVLIGPTTSDFETYFKKLSNKFREKIIDLGTVTEEEKINALSACTMLAVPSKSESFGLVYLEAWLFGKPVIGCNISPITEIINHKKNGILIDYGNVKELSNAITYLLENPSDCKIYGEEGRKKSIKYNSNENLTLFENKCISVVDEFKSKKRI